MRIIPKIEDSGRFIGSVIYFLTGFLIIIYGWVDRNLNLLFYGQSSGNINDWVRILWCLALSFIGFSIGAYSASKNKHDSSGAAWKIYTTIYLSSLIILSILVFAILHISEQTSNYLFYFLSGSICFSLSYFIDDWVGNPLSLMKIIFGLK